jgi:hypothetical protein
MKASPSVTLPSRRDRTPWSYDGAPIYATITAHGDDIVIVIPPRSTAVVYSEQGPPTQRDCHLKMITERGRLAWHKATYFGQRSLVETTMGRYKALLGPRLRARGFAAQQTEAVIGVAVLNTTALGAAELGWYVAEVGRQPWVIEGVLPTFMAVSSLTAGNVLTTLISFITFYSILLIVDTYLMTKAIRLGPAPTDMDIVFRLPADPIAIPAGRVAHLLPHDTAYMAR